MDMIPYAHPREARGPEQENVRSSQVDSLGGSEKAIVNTLSGTLWTTANCAHSLTRRAGVVGG